MLTKESNLPTLRWKKTIGILAIILGGLRFITGIGTYSTIDKTEKLIAEYGSLSSTDKSLVNDLQYYVNFSRAILPPTLIVLATIFILGIVLLCVDKGTTDIMPRPKSYRICTSIFVASVIHLIMEIITYTTLPSSISKEISPVTIIFSISFVLILIAWSAIGLASPLLAKNSYIVTTVPNFTPLARPTIPNETNVQSYPVKSQPELTVVSQLDAEIEQLKKSIEKRKLEKEMQQLDAEKRAEIEQLKKELAELE